MTEIRFRVDMAPGCSVGPGKIALLEGILESGSLSEAARRLGMSYRRAWLLLDSLNRSFDVPLTAANVGGRGGGGVELTAFGREIIAEYRRTQAKLQRLASRRWTAIARRARAGAASSVARKLRKAGGGPKARGPGSKRP